MYFGLWYGKYSATIQLDFKELLLVSIILLNKGRVLWSLFDTVMFLLCVLKGGKGGNVNTGEDEELHALVTGPTNESVQRAVAMVSTTFFKPVTSHTHTHLQKRLNKVIDTGSPVVQGVGSTIHWINHSPLDNLLFLPVYESTPHFGAKK